MNLGKKLNISNYEAYVSKKMPKSNVLLDCLKAFLVGGAICTIGQGFLVLATHGLQLDEKAASAFVSTVMIFLGAFLTGIGVYDQIGGFAGAGSVVPITGFANSVVAPAMEFKREGYVMGVGAKMFSLAGPVLVYGICASVLVGLVNILLSVLGVMA